MKNFYHFLETQKDLRQIEDNLNKQKEEISSLVELSNSRKKIFAQIIKTLEYGLKNETELKNAVDKVVKLANIGYDLNIHDFSNWAKLQGTYGGLSKDL